MWDTGQMPGDITPWIKCKFNFSPANFGLVAQEFIVYVFTVFEDVFLSKMMWWLLTSQTQNRNLNQGVLYTSVHWLGGLIHEPPEKLLQALENSYYLN